MKERCTTATRRHERGVYYSYSQTWMRGSLHLFSNMKERSATAILRVERGAQSSCSKTWKKGPVQLLPERGVHYRYSQTWNMCALSSDLKEGWNTAIFRPERWCALQLFSELKKEVHYSYSQTLKKGPVQLFSDLKEGSSPVVLRSERRVRSNCSQIWRKGPV